MPGWSGVRDAFAHIVANGPAGGHAVAVYRGGTAVVDLWTDSRPDGPYCRESVQQIFSVTKGIAAVAVALLVRRGLLAYDAPIATYWPEFAEAGKDDVTVGDVLSHQAGLPLVDGPVTVAEFCDHGVMAARLAAQAPLWPGERVQCYHAMTFGWLVGEIVRRADQAGRTLGRVVAEDISGPLEADLWIGLPESLEHRVVPLVVAPLPPDPHAVAQSAEQIAFGLRVLNLGGVAPFDPPDLWNSRALRSAEQPAVNAVANARAVARIYAAAVGDVGGCRLLRAEDVETMSCPATADVPERLTGTVMPLGMGVELASPRTPMLGPGSFGTAGVGGSLGCVRPRDELAFGFVTDTLLLDRARDPRSRELTAAVVAAAG